MAGRDKRGESHEHTPSEGEEADSPRGGGAGPGGDFKIIPRRKASQATNVSGPMRCTWALLIFLLTSPMCHQCVSEV